MLREKGTGNLKKKSSKRGKVPFFNQRDYKIFAAVNGVKP
jgi:hypothetical protein